MTVLTIDPNRSITEPPNRRGQLVAPVEKVQTTLHEDRTPKRHVAPKNVHVQQKKRTFLCNFAHNLQCTRLKHERNAQNKFCSLTFNYTGDVQNAPANLP